MSEHAWSLEHLETYVAGGLEPAERDRLEQHAAECATCAAALAEVQALDRSLGGLFTDERPEPALEDRLIQALRFGAVRRKKSRLPMAIRIAIASAAVLLVGIVGAAASQLVIDGELPLPGMTQSLTADMGELRKLASAVQRLDLHKDHFEGTPREGFFQVGQKSETLTEVEELVEASRRKAMEGLGEEFKLLNEEAGLDPGKMLAYNMDRVENVSVPGQQDLTPPVGVKNGESKAPENSRTTPLKGRDLRLPMRESVGASQDWVPLRGVNRVGGGGPGAAPTNIPPPTGFGSGQGGASNLDGRISRAELLAAEARREEARVRAETARTLTARRALSSEDFREAEVTYERYKREAEVALERYKREIGQDSARGGAPPPVPAPTLKDGETPAGRTPDRGVGIPSGGSVKEQPPFKAPGSYYSYIDNRPAPTAPPAVYAPAPAVAGMVGGGGSSTTLGLATGGDTVAGRRGVARGPANVEFFKPTDAAKGDDGKPGAQGEGGQGKARPGEQPASPQTGAGADRPPAGDKKGAGGERQGQGTGGVQGQGNQPEKPSPVPRKIIIRSGDIEFEIDSFDSAVATVTKLVNAIPNGFVATVNSEKLPNGKVRGSVVVRVPPETLDGLVLDLRKELGKVGELKGQRIGSQDITKQYTDLESRLRAAKAMETRLLEIIKTGKGEIKDLLLAEKELGVWRTKIEEFEGELRYYSNMVSLSTLNITLYEKEIRSPAAIIETERVNMGVEVEDVIKSLREAQKAVTEAKGRLTKSELKQHAAGQLQAVLNFEVASEVAGTLQDRLRQLGTVTRLESEQLTKTEGGTGRPGELKTKRADTQFFVSLYNVANIAPRETLQIQLAAKDAETAYQAILTRVEKAGGRVVTSNLNRQRSEQTTGTIHFEVKTSEAATVLLDLRNEGEVLHLQSTENADTQNVTRAKRGFQVTIVSLYNAAAVVPHTTVQLNLATADAEESYRAVLARVEKAGGRLVTSNLNRQRNDQTQGTIHFEVLAAEADAVLADLRGLGEVMRLQSSENSGAAITARSKRGFQVQVWALGAVQPRETASVQLAARDVPAGYRALHEVVSKAKGRILNAQLNEQDKQNVTATLDFEVRRSEEATIEAALLKAGTSIARSVTRAQDSETVIDTKVRFQIVLSDVNRIPPRESITLAIETPTVEKDLTALQGLLGRVQGRIVSRTVSHKRTGEVLANVTVDVPLGQKDSLVEEIKSFGMVRVHNTERREGVPEHALSVARLEIVLQGVPPIVARDDGLWTQLRRGLSTSVSWIIFSLSWALVGLLVVLPWALVSYLIVRLVMRMTRRREATT